MTPNQAKKLAKQIFDEFDKQIVEATNGTSIPPSFIAGLIGNEAGKDRSGKIVRSATRFEKGVFNHLKNVRDGKEKIYNKITQKQLADASDEALRALATSYEATQIMGWHCINSLHCTIADLRNPDKHFFYTVKLLQLNGFEQRSNNDIHFAREMREWNTGRETGKTYHANYVPNAKQVRDAYRELEQTRASRNVVERTAENLTGQNELPMVLDTLVAKESPKVVVERDEPTEAKPGFVKRLWLKIVGAFTGIGGADAVSAHAQQIQALGLPSTFWTRFFWAIVILIVLWISYEFWIELIKPAFDNWRKRRLTNKLIDANTSPDGVVTLAKTEDLPEYENEGWIAARRGNNTASQTETTNASPVIEAIREEKKELL